MRERIQQGLDKIKAKSLPILTMIKDRITSEKTQRFAINSVVFGSIFGILFITAFISYVLFYILYLPSVSVSIPVYLQYDSVR